MFEAVKSIFNKNQDLLGSHIPEKNKARQLMNKMVNLLSTKLELGSPMICLYLLGNPDHYTGHTFVPFYWKNFVNEAEKVWKGDDNTSNPEKVAVVKIA